MREASSRSAGTLDALLDRARQDSAEFPFCLANHLPMALVALERLGAPPERLRDYADRYRAANGLVPAGPPQAPIGRATWTTILGERARETDARAFFTAEVRRLGIKDALGTYLPALVPGVGASALHALMRLSYGLLRTDPDEVAAALGYWAVTYLPLPPATGAEPRTADPAQVLSDVSALPGLDRVTPESDLLWHNVKAVAAEPGFAPVVDWLAIGEDTPRRIAAASLALLAGTMDFCALHAVTGSHWVRLVAPFCPDPKALWRAFWQVVAALVPKMGFPSLPDAATLARWRDTPCPSWDIIAATAVRSDDEHDISLAFSARAEDAHWGDRLYRVVAARRLGLIS